VLQGCRWIVVVHDLDTENEKQLRTQLENAIAPAGARASIVLIPKREIEAWLLYDGAAIAKALRESKHPKIPGNPESLSDPKKHLNDLIWKYYRKRYLNNVHNPLIAACVDMSLLKKSGSFAPHFVFAKNVKSQLPNG
jgi:hypothetical protein